MIANRPYSGTEYELARTSLDVRIAEDAEKQADRAEKQAARLEQQMEKLLDIADAQRVLAVRLEHQTEKLILLTRALNRFTVILIVLTVGLLVEGGPQFVENHKTAPQPPLNGQQTNQASGVTQHDYTTNK